MKWNGYEGLGNVAASGDGKKAESYGRALKIRAPN
jgi:hypothetical protein